MDHNVFLCAFNGFGFDFRLIVHDLKSFNLPFAQRWVLVDPWFDMVCLEKRCLKLDEAYREISKYSNRRKKHDGFRDINMLRKIHAIRALYHQSLVIRSKDYQVMLSEGKEARRIWHTEMLPFCSKASYFRPCCRKTMKFTKSYEHINPRENGNTYKC